MFESNPQTLFVMRSPASPVKGCVVFVQFFSISVFCLPRDLVFIVFFFLFCFLNKLSNKPQKFIASSGLSVVVVVVVVLLFLKASQGDNIGCIHSLVLAVLSVILLHMNPVVLNKQSNVYFYFLFLFPFQKGLMCKCLM